MALFASRKAPICLICQNTTAVMKVYNIKCHYFTKHAAEFDGIEVQLQFDEIEQLEKSLFMLEVFQSYEKDTELVTELNFEIFEVIAIKGKAYSDSELIKNCLEVFTERMFPEKKCVVEQGFSNFYCYGAHEEVDHYLRSPTINLSK